jgi:hypothetical protein
VEGMQQRRLPDGFAYPAEDGWEGPGAEPAKPLKNILPMSFVSALLTELGVDNVRRARSRARALPPLPFHTHAHSSAHAGLLVMCLW